MFVLFNFNYSLANNNTKITVQEIEDIFFGSSSSTNVEKFNSSIEDKKSIRELKKDISLHVIHNKYLVGSKIETGYSSSFYQPIPRNTCSYVKHDADGFPNFDCSKSNKSKEKLLSNEHYILLLEFQLNADIISPYYKRDKSWQIGTLDPKFLFGNNYKKNEVKSFLNKYSLVKFQTTKSLKKEKSNAKYKTDQKRIHNRGIAKCLYDYSPNLSNYDECFAKVIRTILAYPKKSKKKRPGDIFFVIDAFERLVLGCIWGCKDKSSFRGNGAKFTKTLTYYEGEKISKYFKKHKPMPGMVCGKPRKLSYSEREVYNCTAFKKKYYKKFEKFKKNPSNEKVLGKPLIKHIKNVRVIKDIREKLGSQNYALLGDMLNAVVADVKKNNINPNLKQRRLLLQKYSIILNEIKMKIDENDYKSIDKDVSKLTKAFKKLEKLTNIDNENLANIDKSIKVISNINTLIETSILNVKNSDEQKLLIQTSINFMDVLIDSILSVIPEKYYATQKPLSQDLFNEYDLIELDVIVDSIIKKNNENNDKLFESLNVINKSVNTSVVLKKLDDLGIKNKFNRSLNQNIVSDIAAKTIRNNLSNEIIKNSRKLIREIDNDNLSEVTKAVSNVAKEVSSNKSVKTSVKTSVTSSYPDPKFGGQSLKVLIYMSRR